MTHKKQLIRGTKTKDTSPAYVELRENFAGDTDCYFHGTRGKIMRLWAEGTLRLCDAMGVSFAQLCWITRDFRKADKAWKAYEERTDM